MTEIGARATSEGTTATDGEMTGMKGVVSGMIGIGRRTVMIVGMTRTDNEKGARGMSPEDGVPGHHDGRGGEMRMRAGKGIDRGIVPLNMTVKRNDVAWISRVCSIMFILTYCCIRPHALQV